MQTQELEHIVYNCTHVKSNECKQRLNCHPIPGFGPSKVTFVVLGLNPATRKEIWQQSCCDSFEKLTTQFARECIYSKHYGKLLRQLENAIPNFRIYKTVYVMDIVKCPTVDNIMPSDEMIEKCKATYWEKTISALNPKYIICLGTKVAKKIGNLYLRGGEVKTAKGIGGNYWFIYAPHPSQKSDNAIANITREIAEAIKNPNLFQTNPLIRLSSNSSENRSNIRLAKDRIKSKLIARGYSKQGNKMIKEGRLVNIVCASKFGTSIRVRWDCIDWANDFATVYDYSADGGPTCIVPIKKLFASTFIRELKTRDSYANNNGNWTGVFPINKEIAQLVLSYRDRWDIL